MGYGVQNRSDLSNVPFFLSGETLMRDNETIAQVAGRATDLMQYTLMTQVAATGKWAPYSSVAGTDGTAKAKGIYVGDQIAAASLAAADISSCAIVVGGSNATFDNSLLVIENSLTLATVVDATTTSAHLVQDDLAHIGIFPQSTIDIDYFENET